MRSAERIDHLLTSLEQLGSTRHGSPLCTTTSLVRVLMSIRHLVEQDIAEAKKVASNV